MRKTLDQIVEDCKNIDSQFSNQWEIETRLVNLMEEVGELSHDILVTEGKKRDELHAKNIGANLSNLLYEVLMISTKYNIDMNDSWQDFLNNMPEWIEMRNKK